MTDSPAIQPLVPGFGIIPAPALVEPGPGHFQLRADTPYYVNDEALRGVAAGFADFASVATGFRPGVLLDESAQPGAVNFHLGRAPAEGYALTVTSERIHITAGDAAGAFYAGQTLRQLLPVEIESGGPVNGIDWAIPAVRIEDAPRFAYRGMHLDVSRHFFPVRSVKRYIDLIAAHKMNRFHWHLTDDQGWRLEILKYPRLTEKGAWRKETVVGHALGREARMDGLAHGGYYTQDEIREVVRYASQRFVTIVPEIDLPGHASALLAAYPHYACREDVYEVQTSFGIFPNVLCPREDTFAFLADVIGEVAELFPGPYIHIGGDEVITTHWESCEPCRRLMQARGMTEPRQLHGYFVHRLQETVSGFGKTTIGWDDILDGGVDSSATIMAWRGADKVAAAAERGHDVIATPGQVYFDYYQSASLDEPPAIHGQTTLRDVYELNAFFSGLPAAAAQRVLGAQANLWSEYISTEEQLDYMAVPRMTALAEVLWTPDEKLSWNGFLQRLRHYFERLDLMGVNASRSVYAVKASSELVPGRRALRVDLETDGDRHRVRYTLDGSRPGHQSPIYEHPITLDATATVRAAAEDVETGVLYGDTRLSFRQHKALGCELKLGNGAGMSGQEGAGALLVDGVIRTDQVFRYPEWAQFSGDGMDAVIDLAASKEIREVTLGFDAARHRRLYPPTSIEVFVSEDGKSWRSVGRLGETGSDDSRRDATVLFTPVATRYLRVAARNDTTVYSAEAGDYVQAPLYIDEIVVN